MLKLTIQNAKEGKCCSPGPLPSAVPCASVTQRVSLRKQIASKPASGPSNRFGYPAATWSQCHTRGRLDQPAKGTAAVMRHSMQLSEALLGTSLKFIATNPAATSYSLPSTHSGVWSVTLPTCDGPHELRMLAAGNATSFIL